MFWIGLVVGFMLAIGFLFGWSLLLASGRASREEELRMDPFYKGDKK